MVRFQPFRENFHQALFRQGFDRVRAEFVSDPGMGAPLHNDHSELMT